MVKKTAPEVSLYTRSRPELTRRKPELDPKETRTRPEVDPNSSEVDPKETRTRPEVNPK